MKVQRAFNYPSVRVVFDKARTATNLLPASVHVMLALRGKRCFLPTNVKVRANEWDKNLNRVSITAPGHQAFNERIEVVLGRVNGYITQLMRENKPFDFERCKTEMMRLEEEGKTFLDFAAERIAKRNDISEGTRKNHRKLLNRLAEFNRQEKANSIVHFDDLRVRNILAFDNWLHGRNYEQTTIHSYHKFFKTYVHEAMMFELLARDPYKGIHVASGIPQIRRYLERSEVEKVMQYEPTTYCLKRVKDLFLFQLFTGMAYSDMCNFRKEKVIERDGKLLVQDRRIKTAEPYYIVLLPQVVEVLERWHWHLPIITNQSYNDGLKKLSAACGIKAITSHMARHTFAVMALNSGNSIEVVSKMLGHSNIKTTQGYAVLLNKNVEQGFEKLENSLWV
jgi:site-specific recombinase XerD